MANSEQLITEHLDVWTSAVQIKSAAGRGKANQLELYGIKKLRELILELSVRGLLVPQDPNDEPAGELLKKIAAEKAQLVKDGKIKKPKALPAIEDEDRPFELPDGWEWSRLQDLSEYIQRGKGPKYAEEGRVRVVSQKCVQWNGFSLDLARYVDDSSLDKYQEERYLRDYDLLWNSTGTGTVGRINVIGDIESNALVADSHVTVIRTLLENPTFVGHYLSSAGIQARMEPEHEDALVSGTTKQVELNAGTVIALPVPVPPSQEQARIVAKVDELMALCDKLEQQQEASITAHQTLVQTLLDALTTASERDGFTAAWARVADHFDTLFTTEWSIDQLKQTILQLAVMGKLVPQDPNDEPAGELLKKIAAEKAQLVKDGKIKKPKALPAIEDEDRPFELPDGWEWSRLQDLSEYIQRGKGPKYAEEGRVRVVSQKCVQWNGFSLDLARYVDDSSLNKYQEERYLRDNDLLWNSTGTGTVGRINVIGGVEPQTLVADSHVTVIRTLLETPAYVSQYISSAGIQARMEPGHEDALVSGTTKQVELNVGTVITLPIPVPPSEEQARIVAKVDEIMALCQNLISEISSNQETQVKFADEISKSAAR